MWISCCCCCCVASVVSDSVRPHRRQPTRPRRPWDSPGKNTGVGCHFLLQCMKVKSESEVAQSCLTLICMQISPLSWASLPPHMPPLLVTTERWAELPVLYGRVPLAICFTQGSVYMSVLLVDPVGKERVGWTERKVNCFQRYYYVGVDLTQISFVNGTKFEKCLFCEPQKQSLSFVPSHQLFIVTMSQEVC